MGDDAGIEARSSKEEARSSSFLIRFDHVFVW